jgi:hypothetical protein
MWVQAAFDVVVDLIEYLTWASRLMSAEKEQHCLAIWQLYLVSVHT